MNINMNQNLNLKRISRIQLNKEQMSSYIPNSENKRKIPIDYNRKHSNDSNAEKYKKFIKYYKYNNNNLK